MIDDEEEDEEEFPEKQSALDRLRNYEYSQGVIEASRNIALNLIKLGQLTLADIAKVCGLTLEQVQALAAEAEK